VEEKVECNGMIKESGFLPGPDRNIFHMGRSLNLPTMVKVYLPKLKLPQSLPTNDEQAIFELCKHLRVHGFEVFDRPTLALFAIGKQFNIQAAVKCFLEFYKLATTMHFRFPDITQIEQLVADGIVEGIACQGDGTAGLFIRPANYNVDHTPSCTSCC